MLRQNWFTISLLTLYVALILSVVTWGIPNIDRVFLFQMDEWHQLMSIRALAMNHTTTIDGAAHGAVFHFLSAGAFLGIFQILGVINVFDIANSIDGLHTQEKIFIILRISTLLYGIGSVIILAKILKEHIKTNFYWFGLLLFVFSPVWISLSNYFKYDIALIFWILLSIYLMFRFINLPTYKNFFLSAVATGLAFDTKISAAPLFVVFILSYFLSKLNWRQNILLLVNGVSVLMLTVFMLGLPDLILGNGDYSIIISDVVFDYPANSFNYKLGSHFWWYLIFNQFPTIFGRPLSILFVGSLFMSIFYYYQNAGKSILYFTTSNLINTKIALTLAGFLVFALSLYPLKLFSTGNRMLVLMPFMVILTSWAIQRVQINRLKNVVLTFAIIAAIFQIAEGLSWLIIKWQPDPREVASDWIQENIPEHSTIGIMQPLIYQMAPDIILKDYFLAQEDTREYQALYNYVDISASDSKPAYVILTNLNHEKYKFKSDKIEVYKRLSDQNYTEVAVFKPQRNFNNLINDPFSYSFANLVPSPLDITILQNQTPR